MAGVVFWATPTELAGLDDIASNQSALNRVGGISAESSVSRAINFIGRPAHLFH